MAAVGASCKEEAAREQRRGAAVVVAATELASPPADFAAARAAISGARSMEWRPEASKGIPFGFVAVFARPAGSMQVGLVVHEEGDDAARVVYSDELDSHPSPQ